MKVLIIRDTVAGKKPVFSGDVLDLPDQEAKELILMKKAVVAAVVAPVAVAAVAPDVPCQASIST